MKRLSFSCEQVVFDYVKNSHLKTTLHINNPTDDYAFIQFKLTRPTFYLIKCDKKFIRPREEVVVQITLHMNGVDGATNDKIKCYYLFATSVDQKPKAVEEDRNSIALRLLVEIDNLPEQMRKQRDMASSKAESRISRKGQHFGLSKRKSNTQENSIRQKEAKIMSLQSEIEHLKGSKAKRQDKKDSICGWIAVSVMGLAVGVLSSIWV